jgi:hypothetical protein
MLSVHSTKAIPRSNMIYHFIVPCASCRGLELFFWCKQKKSVLFENLFYVNQNSMHAKSNGWDLNVTYSSTTTELFLHLSMFSKFLLMAHMYFTWPSNWCVNRPNDWVEMFRIQSMSQYCLTRLSCPSCLLFAHSSAAELMDLEFSTQIISPLITRAKCSHTAIDQWVIRGPVLPYTVIYSFLASDSLFICSLFNWFSCDYGMTTCLIDWSFFLILYQPTTWQHFSTPKPKDRDQLEVWLTDSAGDNERQSRYLGKYEEIK